ncbi:MAG: hypothetical protein ACRC92_27485 [Peptostreptococcaceae bacterium]
MKITAVLSDGSNGIIGAVDNIAAKTVLTGLEAAKDCKQEIIMGAIGLGLMTVADNFLGDTSFMSGALDGALDVTDLAEAAKVGGLAIVGMAAVTAAQKINKRYEELSVMDDMGDDEFAAFVAGGCKVKKAPALTAQKARNKKQIIEAEKA